MRRISGNKGYGYFLVVLLLHMLGCGGFLISTAHEPGLWGLGLLAYSLGLRHAFDADHIAAIDNTIRKLIEQKKSPLGVGLYFSLGHSTVVFLMVLVIALTTNTFVFENPILREIGGWVGTAVSASFLIAIGLINVFILAKTLRKSQKVDNIAHGSAESVYALEPKGFFTRFLAPAFRMISKSWHMYPLGFLFGLGFDTATEVGLLAISAGAASQSFSMIGILSLPLLFASGMSLMDTLDGAIMTQAYRWAYISYKKKRAYNIIVTSVSVVSALFIGGIQFARLFEKQIPQRLVEWINQLDFVFLGYSLAGFVVVSWIGAMMIWKGMRSKHAIDGT